MELFENEKKVFLDNLPLFLSMFTALLWVGFAFLDYLYEQLYCSFFNISSLVKKEYKYGFHPKYIIDILVYFFCVCCMGTVITILNIPYRYTLILFIISIESIICLYKNYKLKISIHNIANMESISKENGNKLRKDQDERFQLGKKCIMHTCLLIIGLLFSNVYKYPIQFMIIVCIGLFIFYGIKNDSFLILLDCFAKKNLFLTYTIDHLNVIEINDVQYAILLPNNRILNDKIVACKVLFLKTDNGLTYVLLDRNKTKMLDYSIEINATRYEPDFYFRITDDDGFDSSTDETKAYNIKEHEAKRGRNVDCYFFKGDWVPIEKKEKNNDDSNSDCNMQKECGTNTSDGMKKLNIPSKNTNRKITNRKNRKARNRSIR